MPTDGITQKALDIFLGGLSLMKTNDNSSHFCNTVTYPQALFSLVDRRKKSQK